MSPERESAEALFGRAQEDLAAALDVAGHDAVAGYLMQQAVEKALKAVLAAHGVDYPLTHELGRLLAAVRELPGPVGETPALTDPRLDSLTAAALQRYTLEGDLPADAASLAQACLSAAASAVRQVD